MAEHSYYWGGTTVGDATLAPYSDDEFSDLWAILFNIDNTLRTVIEGYGNELAVTAGAGKVTVATGGALVDGKIYLLTVATDITIDTPAVSNRYDRIVLGKDFSAQTVRVYALEGVEGAGEPALTQNDGVKWEVPLAKVYITTAGAITVTDERYFVRSPLAREEYGYFYVPAASGKAATTSGCQGATQLELATNDVDIIHMAFDKGTLEYGVFPGIQMPPDWDGGTIYAQFIWTHPAATAFGVRWGLQGRAYADGDALDQAWGTAQEVVDTGGTTSDLYISGETPAITLAGTPANSQFVILRVYRDATDGDDTLDVDAFLLGVRIKYKRN